MPWLMAQELTEAEGGPTGQPNLRPRGVRAAASWAWLTPGSITATPSATSMSMIWFICFRSMRMPPRSGMHSPPMLVPAV